ncbi:MAG: HAD family hydrolase [Thermodesulfobacteriota bacterium]
MTTASAANSIRAVLFDLDGVIFDSAEANVAFYNHILVALGHPPRAREAADILHREPMDRSLQALLGHGEDYHRAIAFWKSLDPTPFIRALTLFPNVVETLRGLHGRLPLAVATNRTTTARPSLLHFGLLDLFETVLTPIEAGKPKPHPLMMEMALAELGLGADEVVYVGDSEVDEGLCRNAGVRLIAFRNPGLDAWAHVEDFAAIPGLLGLD